MDTVRPSGTGAESSGSGPLAVVVVEGCDVAVEGCDVTVELVVSIVLAPSALPVLALPPSGSPEADAQLAHPKTNKRPPANTLGPRATLRIGLELFDSLVIIYPPSPWFVQAEDYNYGAWKNQVDGLVWGNGWDSELFTIMPGGICTRWHRESVGPTYGPGTHLGSAKVLRNPLSARDG